MNAKREINCKKIEVEFFLPTPRWSTQLKNSFLVPLPQVRPLVTKQVSLWANFQLKQEPTKQSRDSSRCGHADSVIDELSTLRFRVCFPEMKYHFAYLQYTLKDSPYKANVQYNCSTWQLLMTGFKPASPDVKWPLRQLCHAHCP